MYTPAKGKAKMKYRSRTADQISFTVPKGDRDRWKQFAAGQGMGLAPFIRRLMAQAMADAGGGPNSPGA